MGLSLSVLMAICFFLPGAAFALGLSKILSAKSPSTLLDQYVSVGLMVAVLAAICFQAIWLIYWQQVTSSAGLPVPDVAQFVALLSGETEAGVGAAAVGSLQQYPGRIGLYFVVLTMLAWGFGRAANRYASKRLRGRQQASWFDLLRPPGVSFVWATVEVHMDGACVLFAGPVDQFSLDNDGNLERLVFGGYAVKRNLSTVGADAPDGELGHGWREVPGEHLVLMPKESKTINLDYWYVGEDGSPVKDPALALPPAAPNGRAS